jgi:hypothetical protein
MPAKYIHLHAWLGHEGFPSDLQSNALISSSLGDFGKTKMLEPMI